MKIVEDIVNESMKTIVLTQDYVGETLPFKDGWEWYDYCERMCKEYPHLEWVVQYRLRKNKHFTPTTNAKTAPDAVKCECGDPVVYWNCPCCDDEYIVCGKCWTARPKDRITSSKTESESPEAK